MITENLDALKIYKMTQEQYDRRLNAGNIDQNALYLTDYVQESPSLENITAADIGAAPDGYGLGKLADKRLSSISEINNTFETGWYGIDFGALTFSNIYFQCLRVEGFDIYTGCYVQTAYGFTTAEEPDDSGSYAHVVEIRRCYEDEWGYWSDWEFINPPMRYGVEYRTAEVYDTDPQFGPLFRPVYTTLIYAGQTQAGTFTLNHGLDVVTPISIEAINLDSELITTGGNITNLFMDRTKITMTSSVAHGKVAFLVKYTKGY